jgi:hypothetical protein
MESDPDPDPHQNVMGTCLKNCWKEICSGLDRARGFLKSDFSSFSSISYERIFPAIAYCTAY